MPVAIIAAGFFLGASDALDIAGGKASQPSTEPIDHVVDDEKVAPWRDFPA
jgi:hypothetical protein